MPAIAAIEDLRAAQEELFGSIYPGRIERYV
jgi:hypothetical protein